MLKNFELELNSQINSTVEERLALLDNMILFAKRFERPVLDPEKSPHVQMLVKLTSLFRKIRQKTDNTVISGR